VTPAPPAQAELVHQAADVVLFVADSEVVFDAGGPARRVHQRSERRLDYPDHSIASRVGSWSGIMARPSIEMTRIEDRNHAIGVVLECAAAGE
jgi:hypothetical protein